MVSPEKKPDEPDTLDVSRERLARLLPIGMASGRRPIDELLEELEEAEDGSPAKLVWRGRSGLDAFDELEGPLARGETELEELRGIKSECDAILEAPEDRMTLRGAMFVYFLVIAAALVHRDTLLSRQRPRKLVESLRELSLVLREPWRDLTTRATAALERREGDAPS